MIRTQIQLSEEQHRRLHELAAARRTSMAELVREGVAHVLARAEQDPAWGALRAVLGSHRDRDGRRDVSEQHDDYLAEALEDEHRLR